MRRRSSGVTFAPMSAAIARMNPTSSTPVSRPRKLRPSFQLRAMPCGYAMTARSRLPISLKRLNRIICSAVPPPPWSTTTSGKPVPSAVGLSGKNRMKLRCVWPTVMVRVSTSAEASAAGAPMLPSAAATTMIRRSRLMAASSPSPPPI
jgi:hypothetical protein